jgi:hypothetical protein
VAQLGARLDGIEEVVGSNPIGSTINSAIYFKFIDQRLRLRTSVVQLRGTNPEMPYPILASDADCICCEMREALAKGLSPLTK